MSYDPVVSVRLPAALVAQLASVAASQRVKLSRVLRRCVLNGARFEVSPSAREQQ